SKADDHRMDETRIYIQENPRGSFAYTCEAFRQPGHHLCMPVRLVNLLLPHQYFHRPLPVQEAEYCSPNFRQFLSRLRTSMRCSAKLCLSAFPFPSKFSPFVSFP